MAVHICPPDHKHGANATCWGNAAHKCRCDECREAQRIRMLRRRKNIAYGRHQGVLPATTVRDHVNELRAAGWRAWQIGEASGVSEHMVFRVSVHEDARLKAGNAERLLAVRVDDERPAERASARQCSIGTRRRLQALAVIGYSFADVARHVDMEPRYMGRIMTAGFVYETTRAKVSRAYDDLWDKPRVGRDASERYLIRRTKARAVAHGWVPPLAWDDDTIDDPAAVPQVDVPIAVDRLDDVIVRAAIAGERPDMSPVERAEAITILNARNWSAARIAGWLGCNPKTIDRVRARLGLPVPDAESIRSAA